MSDENGAVCKIMFLLNTVLYMMLDGYPTLLPYIQTCMALLSVLILIINQFKRSAFIHGLVIVATAIAILASRWIPVDKALMLMPILYLFGVQSIIDKLKATVSVLGQSIWLLISLAVCYYVFGMIGCSIFSKNNEYFQNQAVASLTFMQLSTLDNVGSIGTECYKDRGFVIAFGFIVVTMLVIHALLNMNISFILAYMSDAHRQNKALLDNNRNLFGSHVPPSVKMCRIGNVLASVSILFFPFRQALNWAYLTITILSFNFIVAEAALQKELLTFKNGANLTLECLVWAAALRSGQAVYFVSVLRILLIEEVRELFKKVLRALWTISPLISFTIFVYIAFSFYLYIVHQRSSDVQTIFSSLIEGLQIITLDDFTVILRKFNVFSSMVILLMMVILNHLLMNVLISEVFNVIEEDDMKKKLRIGKDDDHTQDQPPELDQLDPEVRFAQLARTINYQPK